MFGFIFSIYLFCHIHKELNTSKKFLSNKNIGLEEGTLYFKEFLDSTLVDKGSIHFN